VQTEPDESAEHATDAEGAQCFLLRMSNWGRNNVTTGGVWYGIATVTVLCIEHKRKSS
jgi:hypothetical protein